VSSGGVKLDLTEELEVTWPVWRLVLEDKASYSDIERFWSIIDVLVANEALDAWQQAEAEQRKQAEKK
jgi:hypothetical protein